jgi:hypothetical protein
MEKAGDAHLWSNLSVTHQRPVLQLDHAAGRSTLPSPAEDGPRLRPDAYAPAGAEGHPLPEGQAEPAKEVADRLASWGCPPWNWVHVMAPPQPVLQAPVPV